MGFCVKCGYDITNAKSFCPGCGNQIKTNNAAPVAAPSPAVAKVAPAAPTAPSVPAAPVAPVVTSTTPAQGGNERSNIKRGMDYISSTGAKGFVSPDEYVIYTLSNGVGMNLLSGEGWKNEDAVITNKRLYYNDKSGIISVSVHEDIVDLQDITCARFLDLKPLIFIIVAVLTLIFFLFIGISEEEGYIIAMGIIIASIFAAGFFACKKSFLEIDYAGGKIRFSVKEYGTEKIRAFQRAIFTAKEELLKSKNN